MHPDLSYLVRESSDVMGMKKRVIDEINVRAGIPSDFNNTKKNFTGFLMRRVSM